MSVKLGINIDHVATLRQQRKEGFPDPIMAALTAQSHGAHSIVAHLREDRRHIQDADIHQLKKKLRIPLAMEMAATSDMVSIACAVRPARVCLVPEKREELTTEGGLNVVRHRQSLKIHIAKLRARKIAISLFIDAAPEQILASKALGAGIIELHTGTYAIAQGAARKKALNALRDAGVLARELGLVLHAGHGLDYENVAPVACLEGMDELNIGFAVIARAVFTGLGAAVTEMKESMACAE
jgi:pyridoxine 5-phosphate synthase